MITEPMRGDYHPFDNLRVLPPPRFNSPDRLQNQIKGGGGTDDARERWTQELTEEKADQEGGWGWQWWEVQGVRLDQGAKSETWVFFEESNFRPDYLEIAEIPIYCVH